MLAFMVSKYIYSGSLLYLSCRSFVGYRREIIGSNTDRMPLEVVARIVLFAASKPIPHFLANNCASRRGDSDERGCSLRISVDAGCLQQRSRGLFKSDRGALSTKESREMLSNTRSSSESSYLLS